MNKRLSLSFLIISYLLTIHTGFSQEQVDSVKVLQLINVKKGKSELIFHGEKVIYRVNNEKKNYKGHIDLIDDEGIVVDGKAVKLESISMIMSKTHRKLIRFTGGSTIVLGGLLTASGVSLLALNQGISPYIGVVGLITGIPAVIAGIIPFTHTNHYSMSKGWKPHVISLPVYNEEDEL